MTAEVAPPALLGLGVTRYRRAMRVWDGAVRLTGSAAAACALGRLAARVGPAPRMCARRLHDLRDPANQYRAPSSTRGSRCRPCMVQDKRDRRAAARAAGEPPPVRNRRRGCTRTPRGPVLTLGQAAEMLTAIPCLGCGAVPELRELGQAPRTRHRKGCAVARIRER